MCCYREGCCVVIAKAVVLLSRRLLFWSRSWTSRPPIGDCWYLLAGPSGGDRREHDLPRGPIRYKLLGADQPTAQDGSRQCHP